VNSVIVSIAVLQVQWAGELYHISLIQTYPGNSMHNCHIICCFNSKCQ